MEKAAKKPENFLFLRALEVEKDQILHHEMEEWDITLKDGLVDWSDFGGEIFKNELK